MLLDHLFECDVWFQGLRGGNVLGGSSWLSWLYCNQFSGAGAIPGSSILVGFRGAYFVSYLDCSIVVVLSW